jgi:hypothetical protein
MTNDQKKIIKRLIALSIDNGFGTFFDVSEICKEEGISPDIVIHDEDKEEGILWAYGPYGNGMLSFSQGDQLHASVSYDTHELLANWAQ